MTKKQWLDRCEMVYDLGMHKHLDIALNGHDYFMRVKAEQFNIAERIMRLFLQKV